MDRDYQKLFTYIQKAELPKDLSQKVLFRIQKEEQRLRRQKSLFFGVGALASFVATISFATSLANTFVQSGFYQYVSLVFSGDGVATSYWKELSFSLVESLPIFGIVALLTAVGCLIWSAAHTFSNARRFMVNA